MNTKRQQTFVTAAKRINSQIYSHRKLKIKDFSTRTRFSHDLLHDLCFQRKKGTRCGCDNALFFIDPLNFTRKFARCTCNQCEQFHHFVSAENCSHSHREASERSMEPVRARIRRKKESSCYLSLWAVV